MKRQSLILLIFGFLLSWPISAVGQEFDMSQITIRNSNDEGDTTYGEHGGRISLRQQFVFESVVDADGIRIYVYDIAGKLLKLEKAGGTIKFPGDSGRMVSVELERRNDPKKRALRFRAQKYKRGYYLFAPFYFSLTPDAAYMWGAAISGIPGQKADELRFNMQIGLTRLRGWSCRGHEQRIFLEYKDYPLCEKQYLDPAPFLYQCPLHDHSRSHEESKCSLCLTERVPTRQRPHPFLNAMESGRLIRSAGNRRR